MPPGSQHSSLARLYVCLTTPTHIECGREALQKYGFPIQTYGKHPRGCIFKSMNKKIHSDRTTLTVRSACPYENHYLKYFLRL